VWCCALQICVERFVNPGWWLTELFNGKRATLNACCDVVHSFAMSIIQQHRQQLAEQAAARVKAAAGPAEAQAAGIAAGGSADGSAQVCVKGLEEVDSSAQDLLSLFMESAGVDGKPLNDKELMDTVINFIIAGRDTTAQVSALRVSTLR
jgi:cytochrome P450